MQPRPLIELLAERAKLNQEIGASLRAQRQAAGMNQATFAAQAGMTQSEVSRVERGTNTPQFGTVNKFYKALYGKELPHGNLNIEGRAQEDVRKARN